MANDIYGRAAPATHSGHPSGFQNGTYAGAAAPQSPGYAQAPGFVPSAPGVGGDPVAPQLQEAPVHEAYVRPGPSSVVSRAVSQAVANGAPAEPPKLYGTHPAAAARQAAQAPQAEAAALHPRGVAAQGGYGIPDQIGAGYAASEPYAETAGGDASTVTKAFSIVGALASVALVIGLGVWTYQLIMRDVSGVPVVRALEGEMRVQPEDPGGAVAQHQGLAVNKVATGAGAEGPAEAVALAPDAGGLAEADGPVSAPEVTVAEAAPKVVTPQAPVDRPVDGVAGASADAMALIDSIVAENQPLSGEPVIIPAAPEAAPEVIPAAVPVVSGVIPTSVPGVVRSPRPPVRPAGIGVPGPMAAASASPTVREVPAAQVPAGTRLAQVGAFDSAEIARSEWATLSGRFEEFFQGKERVIEEARSGGDTFYRLRVKGFVDLADSRRFCAALVAGGAPCIPAVAR